MGNQLSPEEKTAIVRSIRQAMWDKELTRKDLVRLTKLGSDTVYDALNLRKPTFSDYTLFKFEKVLGRSFLHAPGNGSSPKTSAPEDMGGYSLQSVKSYIGEYVCVRPDFQNPSNLYVYEMDLDWNEEDGHLFFQEKKRKDEKHTNRGKVYISRRAPVVNLVTITEGSVRHILLSQIDDLGVMRGLIQTLSNPFGMVYIPASTPFVMRKTNGAEFTMGELGEKERDYKAHRELLEQSAKEEFFRHISLGPTTRAKIETDIARMRGPRDQNRASP